MPARQSRQRTVPARQRVGVRDRASFQLDRQRQLDQSRLEQDRLSQERRLQRQIEQEQQLQQEQAQRRESQRFGGLTDAEAERLLRTYGGGGFRTPVSRLRTFQLRQLESRLNRYFEAKGLPRVYVTPRGISSSPPSRSGGWFGTVGVDDSGERVVGFGDPSQFLTADQTEQISSTVRTTRARQLLEDAVTRQRTQSEQQRLQSRVRAQQLLEDAVIRQQSPPVSPVREPESTAFLDRSEARIRELARQRREAQLFLETDPRGLSRLRAVGATGTAQFGEFVGGFIQAPVAVLRDVSAPFQEQPTRPQRITIEESPTAFLGDLAGSAVSFGFLGRTAGVITSRTGERVSRIPGASRIQAEPLVGATARGIGVGATVGSVGFIGISAAQTRAMEGRQAAIEQLSRDATAFVGFGVGFARGRAQPTLERLQQQPGLIRAGSREIQRVETLPALDLTVRPIEQIAQLGRGARASRIASRQQLLFFRLGEPQRIPASQLPTGDVRVRGRQITELTFGKTTDPRFARVPLQQTLPAQLGARFDRTTNRFVFDRLVDRRVPRSQFEDLIQSDNILSFDTTRSSVFTQRRIDGTGGFVLAQTGFGVTPPGQQARLLQAGLFRVSTAPPRPTPTQTFRGRPKTRPAPGQLDVNFDQLPGTVLGQIRQLGGQWIERFVGGRGVRAERLFVIEGVERAPIVVTAWNILRRPQTVAPLATTPLQFTESRDPVSGKLTVTLTDPTQPTRPQRRRQPRRRRTRDRFFSTVQVDVGGGQVALQRQSFAPQRAVQATRQRVRTRQRQRTRTRQIFAPLQRTQQEQAFRQQQRTRQQFAQQFVFMRRQRQQQQQEQRIASRQQQRFRTIILTQQRQQQQFAPAQRFSFGEQSPTTAVRTSTRTSTRSITSLSFINFGSATQQGAFSFPPTTPGRTIRFTPRPPRRPTSRRRPPFIPTRDRATASSREKSFAGQIRRGVTRSLIGLGFERRLGRRRLDDFDIVTGVGIR